MKRILSLFAALLLFAALFALPACAAESDRYFSDFFAALPDDLREALEENTDPDEASKLLGIESLLSLFFSAVGDGITDSLPTLLRFLAVTLLLALLSHLAADLPASSATVAEGGIAALLAYFIFRFAETDLTRAAACLSDLSNLSGGLIPVFFGLFTAGGSTATATASAAGFTGLTYLIEGVCVAVLLPLLRILFAFTAIRAVGGKFKTDGLFSTLRTTFVTLLSFLSLLLVTSLAFQSSLAASADSVAAGAVRFTVGQLVPVVGSGLAGSLRTVAASLSLIKGSLGALSVFALLLLLLPPLVELLLHRLVLSLSASLADMLGSTRAKETLLSFRTVYDLAAATLALCLVLFILIIALLLRCGFAIA